MSRHSTLPHSPAPGGKNQRGAVLFILFAVLGIVAAALFVAALTRASKQAENERQTAEALAQAKDALIGYAATYLDTHPGNVFGYLPCPDMGTGTEGTAAPTCAARDVSVAGKLPWKTLGLPTLRDGNGECLWYLVSGTFKNAPQTNLMNWDTNGQFDMMAEDGSTHLAGSPADPTRYAVAVVFSPASPLASQNRTAVAGATVCGGNYNAANYLDTGPGGISNFFNNPTLNNAIDTAAALIKPLLAAAKPTDTYNDTALTITPDEIFARRVVKRGDFPLYLNDPLLGTYGLLQKTAQCIAQYGLSNSAAGDKRLPWAAPLNLTDFGVNGNYDDTANLLAGRVPYMISTSKPVTNNTLSGSNLLTTNNCPTGWANVAVWWNNWKDQLFYAVADAFKPSSTIASSTYPCAQTGAKCLTVDGVGPYAAVVILSGQKLSGQLRNSTSDKQNTANYLEGNNATAIPAATGNGNFTRIAGPTLNDALVCINQDLTLDPTCTNPVTGSSSAPQVSFANNLSSFVVAGDTNSIKVNSDGSVGLSLNQANKASCFWFPDAYPLAGKTMRAYFEFKFGSPINNQPPPDISLDSKSNGDGFTFTVLRGNADTKNQEMCGDVDKLGYESGNMVTPNLAVEVDTYPDADALDPVNMANHVAVLTGSVKHLAPSCAVPNAGCWFQLIPNRNPNWLEDNALHTMRVEFHTSSSCGTGQVLVQTWIDCSACSIVGSDYTATASTLSYCVNLPSQMQQVKFGFTAASSSGHKQYLNLYNFAIRFD